MIIYLTATSQELGRVVIKTVGVQRFRGLARELEDVHASYVDGCAGLK
jgi:Lon protease-like protein